MISSEWFCRPRSFVGVFSCLCENVFTRLWMWRICWMIWRPGGPGRYHKEQHAGWCIKYSKPDLILRLFSLLHPELCEHFVQLRVETAWCWSLTPVLQWHSLHFMFPAGSLLTEQFCYVQLQSVTNVHSGQTTWDDLVFRSVPDTHSQWWQNNVSSSFQN